jgi:hypothetical protein
VQLAPTPGVGEVQWKTPIVRNAMAVPVKDKVELLLSINAAAINAGADFAGISNGSMCQNMQDICGRFRAVLFEKFVRWPTTPEERQRIRRGFADATDCPGDASPFR